MKNAPDVVVTAVRFGIVSRLMSVPVAPETSASDGSLRFPKVDAPSGPSPLLRKNTRYQHPETGHKN